MVSQASKESHSMCLLQANIGEVLGLRVETFVALQALRRDTHL
jgi:hypothetical protein